MRCLGKMPSKPLVCSISRLRSVGRRRCAGCPTTPPEGISKSSSPLVGVLPSVIRSERSRQANSSVVRYPRFSAQALWMTSASTIESQTTLPRSARAAMPSEWLFAISARANSASRNLRHFPPYSTSSLASLHPKFSFPTIRPTSSRPSTPARSLMVMFSNPNRQRISSARISKFTRSMDSVAPIFRQALVPPVPSFTTSPDRCAVRQVT